MKTIRRNLFFIILILFGAGCGNNRPTTPEVDVNRDSVALIDLVRNVYTWREKTNQEEDFSVLGGEPDTIYTQMDWEAFNNHINALQESGYFHPEFIENHKKIAEQINDELKSGKTVWLLGDASPFGNDADPWCNCQDYPDSYWAKLTLTDLKTDNENATFSWTWGGDFRYKARAKKDKGVWKISYLEGFDLNEYMQ